MLVSSMARFNAMNMMSNAAYNNMQGADSLMRMSTFSGDSFQSSYALNSAEKKLTSDRLQNNLLYKIALWQEKSAKKAQDESIQRSFSYLA